MADLVPDQSGYVDADGRRIYWERFGTGNKETVCLLNGLAMHTGAWYGFVPLLSGEFDVLLWDYLGQGNSSSDDVPFEIPRLCDYLTMIVDTLGIERFHLMGISYGGFVGLEYARRYQHRLHTLTISGILLTHEELFEMYEDLSLRFYRGSTEVFELYTHYLYEKIFGESFVVKLKQKLGAMRENFFNRFKDKRHCLIQLTEAQDRLFAALDERLPEYRAIRTPTLRHGRRGGSGDSAVGAAQAVRHPAEPPVRARRRQRALRLHRAAEDVLRQSRAVRESQGPRLRGRAGGELIGRPDTMTQEERSQKSRAQVLEAALALFSHRGYGATSMREIAERAGVSTGNVYHHFTDQGSRSSGRCSTRTGRRWMIPTSR